MYLHHIRGILIQTDYLMQVCIGGTAGVRAAWDSTMKQWIASLVTVTISNYGSVALVSTKAICYVNLRSVVRTLNAILTVNLPDGGKEEFLITLPRLRIDGLWYGSPYIELTEYSYIQSSTGWLSTVRGPSRIHIRAYLYPDGISDLTTMM